MKLLFNIVVNQLFQPKVMFVAVLSVVFIYIAKLFNLSADRIVLGFRIALLLS